MSKCLYCAECVEFLSQRRSGAVLIESRHGEGQTDKQGLYHRKRSESVDNLYSIRACMGGQPVKSSEEGCFCLFVDVLSLFPYIVLGFVHVNCFIVSLLPFCRCFVTLCWFCSYYCVFVVSLLFCHVVLE